MENDLYNGNNTAGRTVVSTRVFTTGTEPLFSAWTDPEKLAKWWGPKGFTNTFKEFNPQPGGDWKFLMHGPDGTNYKNECVFVRVDPTEIIIDHISWPKFRLTATFEALGSQTKLIFNQEFATADEFEKVKAVVIPANEENFDRLETVLG